ncbi:FG-GAP-like repeat-containing protein [Streptomyces sp. NPDC006743]|uniref:FG-GAP-like repeat-containing protein n=1 Tax=Streptomyces sp. NPDC006743 TaxID=3154480 RepID=UPI0034547F5B
MVLAAAVAMAGLLGPSPARAATGAPVTDDTYAFTAKLDIGDTERSCSGVLVDPQWILTAASCFAADPSTEQVTAGKPAWKTTATVGRTDLTAAGGHVSDIVELVPRPGRDLVMARLAEPSEGITPVAMAADPVTVGDTLTTTGFGRTSREWVQSKLHAASFNADAVDDETIGISGKTAGDAICKGDTGGPILRQRTDGTPELVGISSRSWQGGCFGETETRTGAIAARTDNIGLGTHLTSGRRLTPGDSLVSATNALTMRTDGNLVITSMAGRVLWSTGTTEAGATALLDADGDFVVRNAADTATLWQAHTAAVGGSVVLQDRGNLVVLDASGTARWSSGTAIRHDYNNDGRSDLGAWYDFAAGSDAIYTFFGNEDGSISAPTKSWNAPAGAWDAKYMKRVTGDFDGDGRGDIAALYGYSDTSLKIWMWLGRPDGGFDTPFTAFSSPAGSFHISYMTPQAGDFNGDGRDDIAVWYAYADGTTKLWTFTAKTDGTLNTPASSWSAPSGTWLRTRTKFVTGDFNGDGRDDLSVFYGQGDDSVKTYVFTAAGNGGFNTPGTWWQSASLDWNRVTPLAGDFNGDGRDDALVWYDYADGSDKTSTIQSENVNGTDRFGSATVTLASPAGNLNVAQMQLVVGDYNGDGRDDLVAMNRLSDGGVKFWTWTARADALFNGGLAGWTAPGTNWLYDSTKLVRTHNS